MRRLFRKRIAQLPHRDAERDQAWPKHEFPLKPSECPQHQWDPSLHNCVVCGFLTEWVPSG